MPQSLQQPALGRDDFLDLECASHADDDHVRLLRHFTRRSLNHGPACCEFCKRLVTRMIKLRHRVALGDKVVGDALAHETGADDTDRFVHG